MLKVSVLFFSFLVVASPILAAEITISPRDDETAEVGRIIEVSGEIVAGDELRIIAALDGAPINSLIVLTSPGGLIQPAMNMGRTIRKAGANTLVSGVCASACGLIWLAGAKRFTFSDGQIGFHAAYSGIDNSVTSSGNALIGAYVSELGFGDNVIRYVTEKPPEGMQWLNEREANLLGIDVATLELPSMGSTSKQETTDSSKIPNLPDLKQESDRKRTYSIEEKATAFIMQIVDQHQSDNSTAIRHVYNNYGSQIAYYGKRLSISEVAADKLAYLERWPIRKINVRESTLSTKCDSKYCFVTGKYNWSVENQSLDKKASGTASFAYGLSLNPVMKLIYEDGKVEKRN